MICYNIQEFGAVADGKTLCTKSVQSAIDTCTDSGGGTVYVPSGNYVIGTVYLKNNVHFFLEAGSQLLASLNMDDFPSIPSKYMGYTGEYVTFKSVVYAEDAVNIAITGSGIINGRNKEMDFHYRMPSFSVRPRLIHFRGCRKVRVKDITLKNSPSWVQHYRECEDLVVDRITVDSRDCTDMKRSRFLGHVGMNQDGMDIDGCKNVYISNCNITSGDDGICLKSRTERPCENITITNCTVSTDASGIKLGTESNAGYRNINISNCVVYDTRITGLSITEVDGGVCENVCINGITMNNINGAAIFIRLNERSRPRVIDSDEKLPVGEINNITISNVIATDVGGIHGDEEDNSQQIGCSVTGIPGYPVRNINIHDINISFIGGPEEGSVLTEVTEAVNSYPAPFMFAGNLPAYGFYCRHVEGLDLRNLSFQLYEKDTRPAIVLDDVKECVINRLRADSYSDTLSLIQAKDVDDLKINDCKSRYANIKTLELRGSTNNVTLTEI